ncbi:shikimate dehydrogenase family protein [Xanthomarina spongicola]|uniref:Shikimate dehydrogenase n=1 Tax=Xanthomarina spongicola TaxID=570520 RepID=A0A316DKB1_9FLAO|nr:shikimate dehydrogenase [Xanthomarina spongicola]PWK17699.1 shikimate dehydrogenase [Xanthomarina spongicola]
MNKYGLIGKNISYSFSKDYFNKKFKSELIHNSSYENFDIQSIIEFPEILNEDSNIKGLNVTIPYKELVIPYLDKLDKKAKRIGAVNTIKISKKGKLKGYNTDYYGFKKSIEPYLNSQHKKALILGTGGASKAIAYALRKLKIEYAFVSRKSSEKITFTYNELTENDIKNHQIIINCTPLGTYPNIEESPNIPYQAITDHHILFDLIYNPLETKFLALGKAKKAITINGLTMLKLQADKAWKIWNS